MDVSYLLYVLFGRLIIYFGMQFPPLAESRFEFVKRLFSCDLCLGFWTFSVLAMLMRVEYILVNIPITGIFLVDCVAVGMFTSFITHVFVLGWNSKFSIVEIL